MRYLFLVVSLLFGDRSAEIVDKVVVVVGRQAIKQSDIINEIRYSSFLNEEKPGYDLNQQKKAADRLVDQEIIRAEIEAGHYAIEDSSRATQLLDQLKRRYPSEAAFRQALNEYEIEQDLLLSYLRWQTAVLRFVNLRFTTAGDAPDSVNENFFAWLDTSRKQARIVYREESLR